MVERFPKVLNNSEQTVQTGEIVSCVGPREEHEFSKSKTVEGVRFFDFDPELNSTGRKRQESELDATGFKHSGLNTYVISNVNEKDKRSEGYSGCTGVVLVGYSQQQQQNISLLTHHSPPVLGLGTRITNTSRLEENFKKHLTEVIDVFLKEVDQDTVSATVFGGRTDPNENINFEKNIAETKRLVHERTGIEAHEVFAPNDELNELIDIYFQTQKRRLFIMKRENPRRYWGD